MRFSQEEKMEIIQIVQDSEIGVNRTLKELGIHKSTFYQWYGRYQEHGYDGLAPNCLRAEIESPWWELCDNPSQRSAEYLNKSYITLTKL